MTKFGSLIQVALLYIRAKIDELWHGRSFGGPKILKGVKIVTIFWYIVWSSAVKFGTRRGIGA